jgi:hypothetical protein
MGETPREFHAFMPVSCEIVAFDISNRDTFERQPFGLLQEPIMRRVKEYDPDEDDDDETGGGWQPDDDESEDATLPCPKCQKDVYDHAERCPYCGAFLSEEDEATTQPTLPLWVRAVALFLFVFFVLIYLLHLPPR